MWFPTHLKSQGSRIPRFLTFCLRIPAKFIGNGAPFILNLFSWSLKRPCCGQRITLAILLEMTYVECRAITLSVCVNMDSPRVGNRKIYEKPTKPATHDEISMRWSSRCQNGFSIIQRKNHWWFSKLLRIIFCLIILLGGKHNFALLSF